jgi:hypothetical protein
MTHDPFGPSTPTPADTIAAVASTIRNLNLHKTPAHLHDDVLTMMEFMRNELIAENERLTQLSKKLDDKHEMLKARERELAIKMRTASMLCDMKPAKASKLWSIGFNR